ncbi:hypothetical protein D3C71_1928670 [compost metagenome]
MDLILPISVLSVARSSWILSYLSSKVVRPARVRRTEAPGILGCTALRLPSGTMVMAITGPVEEAAQATVNSNAIRVRFKIFPCPSVYLRHCRLQKL